MSKKIQFQIPQPCHENWEKMTPLDQGKFCMACQKTVIDFTLMSDDEILLQISSAKGNVCGRFMPDQLNRKIQLPLEERRARWKYVWNMILALFLTGQTVHGQQKPMQGKVRHINNTPGQPEESGRLGFITTVPSESHFTGTVVDENNNPIAFATIVIKPDNILLSAGADGTFIVRCKAKGTAQQLEISCVGYDSRIVSLETGSHRSGHTYTFQLERKFEELPEITVVAFPAIKHPNPIQNSLDNVDTLLQGTLGGLIAVQTETITQSIKDTISAVFVNRNVTIYPNPISAGSIMHVRFDLPLPDRYELTIVNSAAQVLHTQKIDVHQKGQVKQIYIPANYSRGFYFMRVRRQTGGETFNKKFIVK